ncbi:MAG: dTMP kinase, partial [Pseudomonadota bacterium]|nr:dTMP kinase [Pseudomonadota bacterium]
LTLLFDLPFSVARERIALQTRELDRFEQERADFHERVRLAYLERANSAPQRIKVINADQALVDIKKSVEDIVLTIC